MKGRQSWADLYAFELIRESDTPLFRQLYLQLRAAILSRRLRPGTKLPSTRELAAQLGVSRSAAVAAYEQLLAEGYTAGRHGSGTYISPDLPEPIEGGPQRRRKPAAPVTSSATQMPPLGDFVDVTVQSDQRPFNLGRTLIDDGRWSYGASSVHVPFVRWMRAILDIPTRAERSSFEQPSAITCRPPAR